MYAMAWNTVIHKGDCCMVIFPPISSAETGFQNNPNAEMDKKSYQPNKSILLPKKPILESQTAVADEVEGNKPQDDDGRISLNIAKSRLSYNPLSEVELSITSPRTRRKLIKEMGYEEFMKTMMEEYDLKVESLGSDIKNVTRRVIIKSLSVMVEMIKEKK